MVINNKAYDIIKWVLFVVIPALNIFINGLCALYGWSWAGVVCGTIDLIAAFVGAVLGFGSIKYKKSQAVITDTTEG